VRGDVRDDPGLARSVGGVPCASMSLVSMPPRPSGKAAFQARLFATASWGVSRRPVPISSWIPPSA
jgi:hypothetical protein